MELGKDEAYCPFIPQNLSRTELHLAFYLAYLMLKPTITKATTVLAYEGHVKYFFREQGCSPAAYLTPFLGQVRKGIKNVYPQQADKREALFVPLYYKTRTFAKPESKQDYLSRLATNMGFFGMLRPHTFSSLGPNSIVMILRNGQRKHIHGDERFQQFIRALPPIEDILRFYIKFKSKTMTNARAYFPNLGTESDLYKPLCPLRMLIDVGKRDWVSPGFLEKVGRGAILREYLQRLVTSKTPVSPYALRIGGRTWNLTHGMDRQFVDYLGTWKSPEASARYYRERPGAVLRRITRFYFSLGDPARL